MPHTIHICSLVGSARGVREFRLLHSTAIRWGTYHFMVACPPQYAAALAVLDGVDALPIINPAWVHRDDDKRDYWGMRCRRLLAQKVDLCREALARCGYAFYMDADSFIVSPLHENLVAFLQSCDIAASPHYTVDRTYNSGMFLTASKEFLAAWQLDIDRDTSGFADQDPFKRVLRSFRVLNLPMRYNVGWWRCSANASPVFHLSYRDNAFFWGEEQVYNFHLRLSAPTDLSRLVEKIVLSTEAYPEIRTAFSIERQRRSQAGAASTPVLDASRGAGFLCERRLRVPLRGW